MYILTEIKVFETRDEKLVGRAPSVKTSVHVSIYIFICIHVYVAVSLRCVRWVILAVWVSQTSEVLWATGPAGVCLCPSKTLSLGPRHGERTAESHGKMPLSKLPRGPKDPTMGTWDLSTTPSLLQTKTHTWTHAICHISLGICYIISASQKWKYRCW